jgi:hypothetical protein
MTIEFDVLKLAVDAGITTFTLFLLVAAAALWWAWQRWDVKVEAFEAQVSKLIAVGNIDRAIKLCAVEDVPIAAACRVLLTSKHEDARDRAIAEARLDMAKKWGHSASLWWLAHKVMAWGVFLAIVQRPYPLVVGGVGLLCHWFIFMGQTRLDTKIAAHVAAVERIHDKLRSYRRAA